MSKSRFKQRYINESGPEARVAEIIEPILEDLDFQLVRVRVSSRDGCTVQVMAERPNGDMGVEECAIVSRAISPILDVEDPISSAYHLEVSSPGIDRPLVRAKDFIDWVGYEAKLETRNMIEGRKRYRGRILSADEHKVALHLVDGSQPADVTFNYEDIAEAKLVTTDDLITAALKRAKAQKAEVNEVGEVNFIEDSQENTSSSMQ